MIDSRKEDYDVSNVVKMMKEEEFGVHISLIDNGREIDGTPVFDIAVDSNLDYKTIQKVMSGLLDKYRELEFSDNG